MFYARVLQSVINMGIIEVLKAEAATNDEFALKLGRMMVNSKNALTPKPVQRARMSYKNPKVGHDAAPRSRT